jgi:hypothetical protein
MTLINSKILHCRINEYCVLFLTQEKHQKNSANKIRMKKSSPFFQRGGQGGVLQLDLLANLFAANDMN